MRKPVVARQRDGYLVIVVHYESRPGVGLPPGRGVPAKALAKRLIETLAALAGCARRSGRSAARVRPRTSPRVAAKGRRGPVVPRVIGRPGGGRAIPPGVCPTLICRPRILSVTKSGVDNQGEHKSSHTA